MDFGVSRDVYVNIVILLVLLSIAKLLFKRLSPTVCRWQKLLKSNVVLSLSPDPFFWHSLIKIHLDLLLAVLFEMRFASLFIFLTRTVAEPQRLEQIEVSFSNKRPPQTTPLISWSYDIRRLTWGGFARSSVTMQTTSITFMMLLGNATIFRGASWRYHSPEVCEGCIINESLESKASVFGRKTNATTIKGNARSACLKICSHFSSNFVESDAELYVNMFLGNVWGFIHCIGLCSSDAVGVIKRGAHCDSFSNNSASIYTFEGNY